MRKQRAFIHAAHTGKMDKIRGLVIEEKIHPDFRVKVDYMSWTPLIAASYTGKADVIDYLVAHGADVNYKDGEGFTPIYTAARENNPDIVKILLDYGANPDEQLTTPGYSIKNNTALTRTVEKQDFETIQVLVEHGANINIPNENGETALYLAVEHQNVEIATYLLEHGADPTIENKNGISSQHLAKKLDNPRLSEMLCPPPSEWEKTDDDTIQHFKTKGQFNIVSMFNFNAMNVTTIIQDTKAEMQSHQTMHFSDAAVDIKLLLQAKDEFCNRNGALDDHTFQQALKGPKRTVPTHRVSKRHHTGVSS